MRLNVIALTFCLLIPSTQTWGQSAYRFTRDFVDTGDSGGDFSILRNARRGSGDEQATTEAYFRKEPRRGDQTICTIGGISAPCYRRGERLEGYELLEFVPFVPGLGAEIGGTTTLRGLPNRLRGLRWPNIGRTFDLDKDKYFEQYQEIADRSLSIALEYFWIDSASYLPALPASCDPLCAEVVRVRHERGPVSYSLQYCAITRSGYFAMTKPTAPGASPYIDCTPVLIRTRTTGATLHLGSTRPALGCYDCPDLPSRPPNFSFNCRANSVPEIEATLKRISSRWSSNPLSLALETERFSNDLFITQGTRAYQPSLVLAPLWELIALSIHIKFNGAEAGLEPRYSVLVSRQNVGGQEWYRGANAAELSTYKLAFAGTIRAESICH
jgi:hypothetical protein